MTEKREINWEGYEQDYEDLRETITKHVWAHHKQSESLQFQSRALKLAILFLSSISMTVVTVLKFYSEARPNLADDLVITGAIFSGVIMIVSGIDIMFNPERLRYDHITAAANKGGISGNLKAQLLLPRDLTKRENPEHYYNWIHDKFATVAGLSPYIPMGLLDNYDAKHKYVVGKAKDV